MNMGSPEQMRRMSDRLTQGKRRLYDRLSLAKRRHEKDRERILGEQLNEVKKGEAREAHRLSRLLARG